MADLIFTVVCSTCQGRSEELTLHDAEGDVRPRQNVIIKRLGWMYVDNIKERDVHLCPKCTAAIWAVFRRNIHA